MKIEAFSEREFMSTDLDLAELSLKSCLRVVEQQFKLTSDAFREEVFLTLIEAKSAKIPGATPPEVGREEPFSLLFRGPTTPVLTDGVADLANEELGTLRGVYITALTPDQDGRYYEAIFG